jgi:tetratricopeptide (TPR) repeat protein
MTARRRYLKLLLSGTLATLLALGLLLLCTGCNKRTEENTGGPAAQGTVGEAEAPKLPDTTWDPAQAKTYFELLDFMQIDQYEAESDEAFTPSDPDAVLFNLETGVYKDLFAEGNYFYRNGEYAGALASYEEILADVPTHFGANNNRTLALLQLGKTDEALRQSVKTLTHYPSEAGCLLNLQICAANAGFDSSAVRDALEYYDRFAGLWPSLDIRLTEVSPSIRNSYEYNEVAQDIEFLPSTAMSLDDWVNELLSKLSTNPWSNGSDPDTTALRLYLEGVGKLVQ